MNTEDISQPNLFILGAPRSGTTAVRKYLAGHPDVAFSSIREPNFFNTDLSDRLRKFQDKDTYLRECFADIDDQPTYVGEKTVWYLYSTVAVENIYDTNPDAKFVVMLRNPVDLVYSLHHKLFEIQQEDVEDFATAWELQKERAAGDKLPPGCPDKQLLQYGEVAKLGQQVKRLFQAVPRDQVQVIIFDDFVTDTQNTYVDLLDFLDISAPDKQTFQRINGNKEVRFPRLQYALRQGSKQLYRPVAGISELVKEQLGIKRWNIMYTLSQLNVRRERRTRLSPKVRQRLRSHFRSDVALLSEIIGRDLSAWLE